MVLKPAEHIRTGEVDKGGTLPRLSLLTLRRSGSDGRNYAHC